MRRTSFLIYVLGLSCASWARIDQTFWANLTALQAAQQIQVVDMNSKKHSGTFVNVTDTAISYQQTAGEQTIQKQDVRSMKVMENKHRARNTRSEWGWAARWEPGWEPGSARRHSTHARRKASAFNVLVKVAKLGSLQRSVSRGRGGRRSGWSTVPEPQHDLPREFALTTPDA
jgi:hypothetical protein